MSRFTAVFPGPKPLIGMIALPPLPGYPAFTTIEALIGVALADLAALEQGGVDGVLVENDFDQPHTLVGGAEIVAAMTRVTREVVSRARVPVGIEVLLNDWRASLAVAAVTGAGFIRLDFFVDRVESKLGVIEPEPAEVIAYRKKIRAESAILSRSATFQADTIRRREFGLLLMSLMTLDIWSIWRPSGAGQERHW